MPWKINLWHCPDTSTVSKWSTSIVKFGSTLPKDMLWNVQEQTLTIFGLRRSVFRTKNQRGGSFSCLNALKNKSLTLPGHFDRFKMVHVDSQIKSKMSETHTSQKFNFTKRLCCEMYKNKHFDRENHVWVALSLYEHWFKMVHVDSQIKEFLKFKSKILPIVSSSFWDTNYYLHLNYVYIIDWPNQFISV